MLDLPQNNYRHRRKILRLLGVDISVAPPADGDEVKQGDDVFSRSFLEERQIDSEPSELSARNLVLSFGSGSRGVLAASRLRVEDQSKQLRLRRRLVSLPSCPRDSWSE